MLNKIKRNSKLENRNWKKHSMIQSPISNFQYQKKGFTLAEVVVVMVIITILMTIGVRVYYDEKKRFDYNNSLTKMLSAIKTARNYAISSYPIHLNGKTITPVNGYGVYINLKPEGQNPHFTVFASLGDEDGDRDTLNKRYDKQNLTAPDTAKDYIIETYRLPREVEFQYFLFRQKGTADPVIKWNKDAMQPSANEAVIFFRPPLADVYLGDNQTKEKEFEEISMRFYNANTAQNSPKKCQYIRIHKLKTFPTIDYSDCSEFNTN